MIEAASRPRLAAKARLRYDRQGDRHLLLYPERGLALNGTAVDVVRLCTGEHTVAGIVEQLAGKYAGQPRDVVEREVLAFLAALADRGLLQAEASPLAPAPRATPGAAAAAGGGAPPLPPGRVDA